MDIVELPNDEYNCHKIQRIAKTKVWQAPRMQKGSMMMTYEVYTTVNKDKNIIVSGVPFGIGQRVKVILMAAKGESSQRVQALKKLFKRTQALPQAQNITEDEIAAEIAAYRSGLP